MRSRISRVCHTVPIVISTRAAPTSCGRFWGRLPPMPPVGKRRSRNMGARQEAPPCCSPISSGPVNSAVPYLVLGVVLLGLLLLAARAIVNMDAAKLGRQLGWVALGIATTGALALLLILIASDRLGLAMMVAGGLLTALFRGRELWRRHFGGAT